ncbi:conserved hypothetical protein [Vibrio phage 193E37-1]|nr:conserved hypothetical protein [Vibrio phage 193E37-1]
MKHNLEQYGMTPKGSERGGIKLLSNKNDCHVKVYCEEEYFDEVEQQIKRHVDCVTDVHHFVEGTEEVYVVDTDNEEYFPNWVGALLFKLDPEQELYSLHTSKYTVTSSSRPNDTDSYNTDRTQHSEGSMEEVITNLYHKPYIHRLTGFTEQEKQELYQLSLRIQELKGMEKESREVKL